MLGVRITMLRTRTAERLKTLDPESTEERVKALRAALSGVLTDLGEAQTKWEGDDARAALIAYQRAAAVIPAGALGRGIQQPSAMAESAVLPTDLTTAGQGPPAAGELPTTAELTNTEQRYEWIGLAIAAAVTFILGMQLLYASNPTWGGPGDIVAALLWGFGVQVAGASSFKGLFQLRSDLQGPAATA